MTLSIFDFSKLKILILLRIFGHLVFASLSFLFLLFVNLSYWTILIVVLNQILRNFRSHRQVLVIDIGTTLVIWVGNDEFIIILCLLVSIWILILVHLWFCISQAFASHDWLEELFDVLFAFGMDFLGYLGLIRCRHYLSCQLIVLDMASSVNFLLDRGIPLEVITSLRIFLTVDWIIPVTSWFLFDLLGVIGLSRYCLPHFIHVILVLWIYILILSQSVSLFFRVVRRFPTLVSL